MYQVLPLFQYPIKIICVDDDQLMLDTLTILLEDMSIKVFTSAVDALAFLEKYQSYLSSVHFLAGYKEDEYFDTYSRMPVKFDLNSILDFRKQKLRYEDIGILIVDYEMPEMDGIYFCNLQKENNINKILLTGHENHRLAVDAFNNNAIHRFINKGHPELSNVIKEFIRSLTRNYFISHTKAICEHLEADELLPFSDPILIQFFDSICLKYDITEFFFINKPASYLLIDKNGREYFFVLETDKTLEKFLELSSYITDQEKFISAIKNREKIPYFGPGENDWQISPDQWENYLHFPSILNGREIYYWSIIDNNKIHR